MFLYVSRPFILDLLYLLSSDKSDLIDDESDDYGSYSGSYGTCNFPFRFYDYFGRASGVGSGLCVPIVFESNCDIVILVVFVQIGVESKGG